MCVKPVNGGYKLGLSPLDVQLAVSKVCYVQAHNGMMTQTEQPFFSGVKAPNKNYMLGVILMLEFTMFVNVKKMFVDPIF